MTAGTLKGKDGTVDSPERCGIITFNFNEFLSEPHEEDWDTVEGPVWLVDQEVKDTDGGERLELTQRAIDAMTGDVLQ